MINFIVNLFIFEFNHRFHLSEKFDNLTDFLEDIKKVCGNLVHVGRHFDIKLKINFGIICNKESLVDEIASHIKGQDVIFMKNIQIFERKL